MIKKNFNMLLFFKVFSIFYLNTNFLFSQDSSKVIYGFYTEENSGIYKFNFQDKYSYQSLEGETTHTFYRNFKSGGFGLNIINNNFITTLGIRVGIIEGMKHTIPNQINPQKATSLSTSIHSSYGYNNILQINYLKNINKIKFLRYFNISFKYLVEKEIIFLNERHGLRNVSNSKNNSGICITTKFVGLGYIIPHLKFEKFLNADKENLSVGVSFYFKEH